MHYSRMCTTQWLTKTQGWGVLPSWGICLFERTSVFKHWYSFPMALQEGRLLCGQTDTCENITFPQLHLWVAIRIIAKPHLLRNEIWKEFLVSSCVIKLNPHMKLNCRSNISVFCVVSSEFIKLKPRNYIVLRHALHLSTGTYTFLYFHFFHYHYREGLNVFIKHQLEHKVLFSKYINVHYSNKRKCLNHEDYNFLPFDIFLDITENLLW